MASLGRSPRTRELLVSRKLSSGGGSNSTGSTTSPTPPFAGPLPWTQPGMGDEEDLAERAAFPTAASLESWHGAPPRRTVPPPSRDREGGRLPSIAARSDESVRGWPISGGDGKRRASLTLTTTTSRDSRYRALPWRTVPPSFRGPGGNTLYAYFEVSRGTSRPVYSGREREDEDSLAIRTRHVHR